MARKVLCEDRPRFREFVPQFNPNSDIQEVEQFGFVNLAESFDKGIIPGGISMDESAFNCVVNPGTLISRSMDVFDGIRKRDYVRSQLEKLNAAEREKAENAMNRQAEKESVTPSE